jgi:hypothetical protein
MAGKEILMSIVPMSRLSQDDLAHLGNNLSPRPRKRRPNFQLQAINRSLATFGERVTRLYRPTSGKRLRTQPA